ncbi:MULTISPECIES: hypothetical protein [Streptacidiphilus]|uniref:Uncharacterized protein n=1 Tax=Streptacidiphilus cavernicola TaxID=3342716 RepID=A0ABV6UUL3_9ACTN|nr:hypothetical protein [Streptacidiphilus jeojiense]
MQQFDQAIFSVLGASKSGKSSYLMALYSTMDGIDGGFNLNSGGDDQQDIAFASAWDAFVETLQVPPTDGEPVEYTLVFGRGLERKVDIKWTDFRAHALMDLSPEGYGVELVEQVNRAHTIFVVLDGEKLRRPIAPADLARVKSEMQIPRMTKILTDVFQERKRHGMSQPSVIVLVTKADTISWQSGDAANGNVRSMQDVVEDVSKRLLPYAFLPEISSAICPVSIGSLGLNGDHLTGKVEPKRVGAPLLIALVFYYETRLAECNQAAQQLGRREADIQRQLLNPVVQRPLWVHNRAQAKLRTELDEIAEQREGLEQRQILYADEITKIRSEILHQQQSPDGVIPAPWMSGNV